MNRSRPTTRRPAERPERLQDCSQRNKRPVCDGQFHRVQRPSIDNEANIDRLEIDFSPLSIRDTIE